MESEEFEISKLANKLLGDIDKSLEMILQEQEGVKASENAQVAEYKKFVKTIEQFQPSPQLLDQRIRSFVQRVVDSYTKYCLYGTSSPTENDGLSQRISAVFYQLSKVRGTKTISNCLSSDISTIKYVLERINQAEAWETRFFLLVWLSVLILAPFPLVKLGSSLPQDIYSLALKYLKTGGKETDAAAVLMARFLSRVDAKEYLDSFIVNSFNSLSWNEEYGEVFARIGVLKAVNDLLRFSSLDQVESYLPRLLTLISNEIEDQDSSVLKLFVKILGKMSLFFLKQEKYGGIEHILTILLEYITHNDTVIRYSVSKQISKIVLHLDTDSRSDVLEALLALLELPDSFEFDQETIDIEAFHGVLLTLGELCRLKLLDSTWISRTASLVHRTLFVEQQRLTHTIGSNVRDASCFCCWSVFKKYRDAEIPPAIFTALFKDLMLVSCFDGDLMIRRAASATLQELIGRHGDLLFGALSVPAEEVSRYKVQLVETLDYSVLGHLEKAYQLPWQIYSELGGLMYDEFVDFLFRRGVKSPNYALRKLSAQTLRQLLSVGDSDTVGRMIQALTEEYQADPQDGLLFTIGELLTLASSSLPALNAILSEFKFDFHRDSASSGEEYLHLLDALIRLYNYTPESSVLDTVFNIIRMNRDEITAEFMLIAKHLRSLPPEYEDKWIYYTRNGNIACAKALGYSVVIGQRIAEVLAMIDNTHIEADLRASLINSVSTYLGTMDTLDEKVRLTLVNQLDDYTVTNKGDVGSHVRLAAIALIKQNPTFFGPEIECKLLRLSCEVMDNVKIAAFSLLQDIKGWNRDSTDLAQLLHDPSYYFDELLDIYDEEYLGKNTKCSREFWKGYGFSAGSSQAADISANSAIHSFFRNWEKLQDSQKCSILNDILFLLWKDPKMAKNVRFGKMQTACLKLMCNLIELNLQIPASYKLETLFVRTYNLTLGSAHLTRLNIAIRIFTNLYLRDSARFHACKQRLEWLKTKHRMPKVRERAAQALEEIEYETN